MEALPINLTNEAILGLACILALIGVISIFAYKLDANKKGHRYTKINNRKNKK